MLACARMNKIVMADDAQGGVREKREGEPCLLRQGARGFRSVNADGYGLYAGLL